MEFRTFGLDITEAIARIRLSRATASIGIDQRFLRELEAAAEVIQETDGIHVTVVSSDGEDFCVGWEEATRAWLLANRRSDPTLVDPFGQLASMSCPVIVSLQGKVASAGLELALACDVRIAAADAVFSLPEVSQGILPLAGGSQRLPRIIGRGPASAMLLFGEQLNAERAYSCGLVSRIAPTDSLTAVTEEFVGMVGSRGPIAVRYAKEAINYGIELTVEQALRYELDLSVILQTTTDREEGVQAFLAKRPPRFNGT